MPCWLWGALWDPYGMAYGIPIGWVMGSLRDGLWDPYRMGDGMAMGWVMGSTWRAVLAMGWVMGSVWDGLWDPSGVMGSL